MLVVHTEASRVEIVELPVLLGCCHDEPRELGWLLDPENLFFYPDGGFWVLGVNERSCVPLDLITKSKIEDVNALQDSIQALRVQEEQRELYAPKSNTTWDKIILLVSILAGAMVVIFAMQSWWG